MDFDLVDLMEHRLDEIDHVLIERRRCRITRHRVDYFNILDDTDFRARFRLPKLAVRYIHSLIKDQITSNTQRNNAVDSKTKLLLTLRFLATGSYIRTTGDFIGVSESTASRNIKVVTEAIANLRATFIKFPEDLNSLKENFYNIARFPSIIGAIDCTHVNIISPGGESAESFRNRKSNFSINVQVVCDAKMKCLDIVARWPGSTHDQTIFNNSSLKQRFESGEFGSGILLADSGYEMKNYILTPFLSPSSEAENLYNESHIRTRNTIERCFGVCKNRFPVLRRQITLSLDRVQAIIVACFILHNIAIQYNDVGEVNDEDIILEDNTREVENHHESDTNARNRLVQEYFQQLLNN